MPPNYNGESDRKQSSVAHANARGAARLKVTTRENRESDWKASSNLGDQKAPVATQDVRWA